MVLTFEWEATKFVACLFILFTCTCLPFYIYLFLFADWYQHFLLSIYSHILVQPYSNEVAATKVDVLVITLVLTQAQKLYERKLPVEVKYWLIVTFFSALFTVFLVHQHAAATCMWHVDDMRCWRGRFSFFQNLLSKNKYLVNLTVFMG